MNVDRIHHWMETSQKNFCKSVSELLDFYNCETSSAEFDKKHPPKQSPCVIANGEEITSLPQGFLTKKSSPRNDVKGVYTLVVIQNTRMLRNIKTHFFKLLVNFSNLGEFFSKLTSNF